MPPTDEKPVNGFDSIHTEDIEKKAPPVAIKNEDGDELVPQPSSDPRDPLNWPQWKKTAVFATFCYATFTGIATAVANNLALNVQAIDMDTTPTAMSFSISAVLAGIIVGPVLLIPLVRIFGAMSCSFWSMIGVVATSIWSALANGPSNYTSFVASRAIAGLFCGTAQVFIAGVLTDMYFLHQRGKAFAVYSTVYMVATVAGPTFGGFIVQTKDWPLCFWWTVAANALAAVLIFMVGDHTVWDREKQRPVNWARNLSDHRGWFRRRADLFFPGTRVVAPIEWKLIVSIVLDTFAHALSVKCCQANAQFQRRSFVAVFAIGLSPITILAGLYSLISFAWFIMAGVQAPILLQEPYSPPVSLGYGFSPQDTSFWYFSAWVGALLAVAYGLLVNDRLPMWFYHRNNRTWRSEYRLQTAWLPGLFLGPIGCGLFGAGVFHHLHPGVMAFGECLIVFAAVACVPPTMNYIIEAFHHYPQEVAAIMNVYRLGFAIAIQFFYEPWVASIGVNWVWCVAAFLSLFGFSLILVLMLFGPKLKKWNLLNDEAGFEDSVEP